MSAGGDRFLRATLFSLFGPLVWAAHFGALYGGQHVACSPPALLEPLFIRAGIVIATIAAAAPLLFAACHSRRTMKLFGLYSSSQATRRFLAGTMRLLSLLSLFGVAWAGSAALFLGACPPLR